MDNDKLIKEVFGGQHPTLTTGITSNPGSHLLNRTLNNNIAANGSQFQNNIIIPQHRLTTPGFIDKPWQSLITTSLIGNKPVNLFINISPSAGKTLPIILAYKELLKRATPSSIPKIIWVAETKLLAAQVERQLQEMFFELIIKKELPAFMIAPFFNHINPAGNVPLNIYDVQLDAKEYQYIQLIIKKWTGVKMSAEAEANPPSEFSLAITCTYSFASELIKKYNPKIVVIDEVQERFKPENKSTESESDKVRHLFNNIKVSNNSPGTSVAILTGSLNPLTSRYIMDYLDENVPTKTPFIYVAYGSGQYRPGQSRISGEANKANITILPSDIVRKDIPRLIIEQIKGKNGNNLIAIFSKNKITEFAKEIISSTPRRDMRAVLGIKNHTVDINYKSHMRQVGRITPRSPKPTLTVHASKAMGLENSPDGLFEKFINMKDSVLQESIAHGFGYIMAEEKDLHQNITRAYDNDDIYLVEQLFAKGLIYSIMATTSVGVGVNLKVRALYIPSIDVFNKDVGKSIRMSISSLAQLVHRAGRKQGENAIVYCNKKDLPQISDIMLSGNPSELVELIPEKNNSERIGILDRFKYARSKFYRDLTIYKLIQNNLQNSENRK